MRTGLLFTGVAVAALVAGGASATLHKSHHKHHSMGAGDMYAAPAQPIPYAQLDSYLAAKPSQRASMGDSNASMGASAAPQAADNGMSPPASPSPQQAPASDQMGSSNSGAMNGMSSAPPATGDTATPPAPAATQGAPDGSSPPPK